MPAPHRPWLPIVKRETACFFGVSADAETQNYRQDRQTYSCLWFVLAAVHSFGLNELQVAQILGLPHSSAVL